MKIGRIFAIVVCLALLWAGWSFGQAVKPEKPKLVLAVGGQEGLIYLPLTAAARLGYFKEAGLDIDIQNLSGGGQALRAIIGGSADVVSGFYDHTIQMQAQGKKIKAVVMQQRYPGLVLLVTKAAFDQGVKKAADLKGKTVGVTALGSSSHFFVNYLVAGAGLTAEDYSPIAVGLGGTAIAAVKTKQISALSALEPTVSALRAAGDIGAILADTRTTAGTKNVFGGTYPSACVYFTEDFIKQNPNTVQAVVNAMVKTLRWIHTHKVEEIVAVMPQEFYAGSKEIYTQAVKNMVDSYSPDGRISPADAQNVVKVMSFDPAIKKASINIPETFDMRFIEAYWKAQKK